MNKKKKPVLVVAGCIAVLTAVVAVFAVGVEHVEKRLMRKLAGL